MEITTILDAVKDAPESAAKVALGGVLSVLTMREVLSAAETDELVAYAVNSLSDPQYNFSLEDTTGA